MSFGSERIDRTSRRLLVAMIAAGAALTALSFALQADPGTVKAKLKSLVEAGVSTGKANAPG